MSLKKLEVYKLKTQGDIIGAKTPNSTILADFLRYHIYSERLQNPKIDPWPMKLEPK